MTALLEVKGLSVEFDLKDGTVSRVINDLNFSLTAGQTLGIVGESGCGKSMTALAIMGLVPMPPGRVADGVIALAGEDLLGASESRLREVRGNDVSMIFQEPMTSLNPVYTIGDQIGETVRLHQGLSRRDARERAVDMLRAVSIPAPEKRVDEYPHQLSGGMRQRVMIAMALACQPQVLIADEPTTALDVTVQAQIFDLLKELQEQTSSAIILITHDMGVVAEMADDVAVMYAGTIVERADAETLFGSTRHPYTAGLLASIPGSGRGERERLVPIPGTVPPLHAIPDGCAFAPRCGRVRDGCEAPVVLRQTGGGHHVACVNPVEVAHA